MLELGPSTPQLHDEIARKAMDLGIDVIAGIGEFESALKRLDARNERVVFSANADGVWSQLASRLSPDAIILLKGSRGVRLERLVPVITAWAQGTT